MPEQASYDVTYYELTLEVDPGQQSIEGTLAMTARIVQPMHYLVLDLDTLLAISGIREATVERRFHREGGKVWIDLQRTRQPGEMLTVSVDYGGKPRVAPRAPWDGGFTWATTSSGAPWVATTCQSNGADLWWPCKDHVSDEPDSMDLHITVAEPLVVATNGRLRRVENLSGGRRTYHWFISTPINIYNVSLNIAPYRAIEGKLRSVAGDEFPVVFYVLPEDYDKGQKLFPEILEHVQFYERHLGPYPWRADKYGVVQTPHLGMEHQTIIAYGANFSNTSMTGGKDWGFDALHHHELGHEWWGNLVTNYDWKDMWIHEGFCTYMQALYMEEKEGMTGYHDYMNRMRFFRNTLAIAPHATRSSEEIYQAPIYTKGAWVLHSLRYLIGDEALRRSLRRMCYPDPAMELVTDGRQARFVTTEDFIAICEEESDQELEWFFELYVRQPKLPVLRSRVEDNQLRLQWETPDNLPFPMPVDVMIDGKVQRVAIPVAGVTIPLKEGQRPEVDPQRWVLMEVK